VWVGVAGVAEPCAANGFDGDVHLHDTGPHVVGTSKQAPWGGSMPHRRGRSDDVTSSLFSLGGGQDRGARGDGRWESRGPGKGGTQSQPTRGTSRPRG
jgi:hypothetical protein